MTRTIALALPLLLFGAAHARAAETDAAQTIRLTPEQIAKLQATGTEAKAQAAAGELPVNGVGRQVHGEVGVIIGTNGARGMFGTAAIPIGETGGAIVSFENSRYGRR